MITTEPGHGYIQFLSTFLSGVAMQSRMLVKPVEPYAEPKHTDLPAPLGDNQAVELQH